MHTSNLRIATINSGKQYSRVKKKCKVRTARRVYWTALSKFKNVDCNGKCVHLVLGTFVPISKVKHTTPKISILLPSLFNTLTKWVKNCGDTPLKYTLLGVAVENETLVAIGKGSGYTTIVLGY